MSKISCRFDAVSRFIASFIFCGSRIIMSTMVGRQDQSHFIFASIGLVKVTPVSFSNSFVCERQKDSHGPVVPQVLSRRFREDFRKPSNSLGFLYFCESRMRTDLTSRCQTLMPGGFRQGKSDSLVSESCRAAVVCGNYFSLDSVAGGGS